MSTVDKNSHIEKLVFDCKTKQAADEFKRDLVAAKVPSASIKMRKIPKTESYKMTVTNFEGEINRVISMLMSPEYGLSLEEIQNFLNIKFVLPD